MLRELTILHVGKFYPPVRGGMERVLQLLCETKYPRIRSTVLVANTSAGTKTELYQGVQLTRVGAFGRIGSVGVCPRFPLELGRATRDVTVIHEPNPIALVSDWLTAQRGPLVVWFHSEVFRPRWKYRLLYRPFLRRVLKRARRIVVSSPRLAEAAAELTEFRDKCAVIPFGIDTDRLKLTADVAERIADIDRRFPGPRVLFVGRLVPYKGVDVLLRAMRSVDATALVIGDGPLRRRLGQDVARTGLTHVKLLGELSEQNVVAHLHACDVFVLPSVTDQETFGVAQLEAMACGKPVVSTSLRTGVPWVNCHGVTGLVVPPNDSEALASALNNLLRDAALRRRMGEAAVRRVEHEFTVTEMTTRAADLYRAVATESTISESLDPEPKYAASARSDVG